MDAREEIPQISVLCVVFNKAVGESATLSSLLRLPSEWRSRIELIVRDNSTSSRIEASELSIGGFEVVVLDHDGVNRPLGEVYRRFAERARGDIVLFFDDDTEADIGYIAEAVKILEKGRNPELKVVCVPRIFDQSGRLFSPARQRVFRGKPIASLPAGRYSGLIAVMSGLATTKRHLKRIGSEGFCVKTPLYGVDTMFMCANHAVGGLTAVAETSLTHRLSRDVYQGILDHFRRTWLEAIGIWWTVATYQRRWLWVAPLYILYFLGRRTVRAWCMSRSHHAI